MEDILSIKIFNIDLYHYLIALLIIILSMIVKVVFDKYISKILYKWASKTKFNYDDILIEALHPIINALFIVTGIYLAFIYLDLPKEPVDYTSYLNNGFKIALNLILFWCAIRLTDMLSEILKTVFLKKDGNISSPFNVFMKRTLKIIVIIIGGVLVIQNMGYSVGSLLAGLGIGGLAVALAAQDTLANFLASLVMLFDKPFKIGDWIIFKNVDGTVESLGFRTTRIRTWTKSVVIIPNKLLVSEIIENPTEMDKRRVKQTIGLTYNSNPELIKQLINKIEFVLKNDPEVHQEYIVVRFSDFAPSSLEIIIYYFTIPTDWDKYLIVKERINFQILEFVKTLGLSFAYPSSTLYFGESLNVENKGK